MKLPINKLKKVSSDATHTVLQHEDGHQVRVAHAPLSPKMRSQLAALPSIDSTQPGKGHATPPGRIEKMGQVKTGGRGPGIQRFAEGTKDTVVDISGYGKPSSNASGSNPRAGSYALSKNTASDDPDNHTMSQEDYNAQISNLSKHAEGGSVESRAKRVSELKGINVGTVASGGHQSHAGAILQKTGDSTLPKMKAQQVLSEMKSMPKPKLLAEGGVAQQGGPEVASKENYGGCKRCPCPDCSVQKFAPGGIAIPQTSDQITDAQDHGQPGTQLNMSDAQGTTMTSPPPPSPEWESSSGHLPPAEEPKAMDPESPAEAQNSAPAHHSSAPESAPAPGTDQNLPEYNQAKDAAANPSDEFMAAKEAHRTEYAKEDAAFDQDLHNGHITPKTYSDLFADKSTLGKVGMMFGMLLSGAGSGMTGQPNVLLGMMDKTISNDLEAQRRSKDNAQNFLKINQQQALNNASIKLSGQTGKLTEAQTRMANIEAEAKTRMMMNRAALHKLVTQMNALPDGPQKQAAQSQLAMMSQQVNNENYNIADRAAANSALLNYASPSPASGGQQGDRDFQSKVKMLRMSGNTAMADDMENKHFPGLNGLASSKLSGEDKDYLNSGITFHKQLNDFYDWTKNHSGDLNPVDRKEGLARAADVQGAYRQATHGGVYKEGEQNFISKLIDSTPTKFFNNVRVLPSLKAIQDDTQQRLDQHAKNLGFDGYHGVPQDNSQQSQQSGSPQIKTDANGVRWMRGPNGKAIRAP